MVFPKVFKKKIFRLNLSGRNRHKEKSRYLTKCSISHPAVYPWPQLTEVTIYLSLVSTQELE